MKNYLDSGNDDNPALFVSLLKPYKRLEISGVEIRLRELGKKPEISRVYPHKFRKTLATKSLRDFKRYQNFHIICSKMQ